MTQIIQLITKYFDDVPHAQKDRKWSLIEIICYDTNNLPNLTKSFWMVSHMEIQATQKSINKNQVH